MFYLPNMHCKVSINVVSVDVNVIPRYLKPLMHVHKVQITNLDDEKALELWCTIKPGHRDFRFLGSVITPNVMDVILFWCYHNLENIFKNEFSKSQYNTEVVVLFYCSATTKLYMCQNFMVIG